MDFIPLLLTWMLLSFPPNLNTAAQQTNTSDPTEALCSAQKDCETCLGVEGKKCFYCHKTDILGCKVYPAGSGLPPSSVCPLNEARWGTCSVNLYSLIIGVSVAGGILLLIIIITCYYCCRRKKPSRAALMAANAADAKWDQAAHDRHQRFEERKAAREVQMNTIRQKYGLTPQPAPPPTPASQAHTSHPPSRFR